MQCKVCWFVYDPEEGLPEFGIEPGTPFNDLPEDCDLPRVRPSQGELHSGRRLLTGAAGKRRIIRHLIGRR
ncbi:MAG: rubredoxin [Sutterella wadsworthensis]